ncbi:MAG: hypothetical protein CM1200mP26_29470 [Acidimicrobiales bacterium]|nr:MAG: hypothetical protein CM1200mP26_29470 [Acidimicrobiales bacterium]
MAALKGALPFAQMDQAPMAVAQNLDLHVSGPWDVPLQEHPIVAERGHRLPLGGGYPSGEVLGAVHDVHALTAATSSGLHEQGVSHGVTVSQVFR